MKLVGFPSDVLGLVVDRVRKSVRTLNLTGWAMIRLLMQLNPPPSLPGVPAKGGGR